MEAQILVNRIITPDGTAIQSNHRHDFVIHDDKNGKSYGVDGGMDYLKRIGEVEDCIEASITSDSPFEDIRKYFERGGRGKDGFQPLTWVPLSEMSTAWVCNVIEYEMRLRPLNPFTWVFIKELEYRNKNKIYIKD